MYLLEPTYFFKQITDIQTDFLLDIGYHGLILDIDDTLAPQEFPTPTKDVLTWIYNLKKIEIKLVLASNNSEKRVSEFAKILDVPHVYEAKKPFRKGLKKAIDILSLPKENILMIGDQIFSDILGAKFTKINSALVEPLSPARSFSLKVRRRLELPIRKKLLLKGSKITNLEYAPSRQGMVLNEK